MAKVQYDYDTIVVGGGAAGTVAAEIIARAGKRVALVERDVLGGSVPNKSDIPMAALMTAAHALDSAQRANVFGLRTNMIGFNFPSLKNWKDLTIKRSGVDMTAKYLKSHGIEIFRGRAHFLSANEIAIGNRHLTAEKFILATGAKPLIPKIVGLENIDFLTPETAVDLLKPPKSLFVIGAGATGCQFAEMFAIFGAKVYLADAKKRILSRTDEEVSELFTDLFARVRSIEILSSSRVINVQKEGSQIAVTYLNGETEHVIIVEKVLIAAGLEPDTDLGLENAGIEYDHNGVRVDEFLQTTARNIWAAGDVLGRDSQAQDAIYEGKIAARNLLYQKKTPVDYLISPRVVRLNPEIAIVGATEINLVKSDIKFRSSIVQNSIVARANTANFAVGFAKILTNSKGMILGATIVAPNASESINEISLAIRNGLTAAQVAETLHPFGSWSEVVRLACTKV